jgi:hypothetical protein
MMIERALASKIPLSGKIIFATEAPRKTHFKGKNSVPSTSPSC